MGSFFRNQDTRSRSTKDSTSCLPWIEKYRPKSLNNISAQEETLITLNHFKDSLPHMLFYGPPGTGKTSTILALARELFGSELMKSRVLELNASHERGISVIRERVKNYARNKCPGFKIIILDEADSLTKDAQEALRRIIEKYSELTRFCLICNQVSCIIPALKSRCTLFRFKSIGTENMRNRLSYICEQEGINYYSEALDELIKDSQGDLRKAITWLNNASKLHKNDRVTVDTIKETVGIVPDDIINDLIESAASKSYDKIQETVSNVIASGYFGKQIIEQVFFQVLQDLRFSENHKCNIGESIGIVDKRLVDGGSEFFQVLSLMCKISENMN
ncbi:P-loop containing nucleoside triphosphate hydrolase protein [Rhizophagus irregularis]|uniref:P-loop containing nucleoside triphosphate hydrolase protein n=1 Tax=Rhizophagus irregularis TaxID=588596 RepID=A0A2N1MCV6_9GLOM|nr:P-loop containing nucleoside triphosphate hydrolase protein [Rhizophagus irregularis]